MFTKIRTSTEIRTCYHVFEESKYENWPFYIISPFGNCQMFSLGNAKSLTIKDPEKAKKYIEYIKSTIEKKLCMLDLNAECTEKVLAIFKPFINEDFTKVTPYVNGNDSPMNLVIIKFKTKKT